MTFEKVWQNILAHEGERFHTVSGFPFFYKIDGGKVCPVRVLEDGTKRPSKIIGLPQRRHFEDAWEQIKQGGVNGPGDIKRIYEATCVYAILADSRIVN